MVLICKTLNPFNKVWFVEISSVVLDERFLKFVNVHDCIFVYSYLSPLGKERGPSLKKKLNPLHPRMLCAKFGWNGPGGSWEEDSHVSPMYFRYFVIISPWKRLLPFFCSNLNPLYPGMFCAKFPWNWPGVLKKKKMKKWKVYRRTTDDRWSKKLTWAFSSEEL